MLDIFPPEKIVWLSSRKLSEEVLSVLTVRVAPQQTVEEVETSYEKVYCRWIVAIKLPAPRVIWKGFEWSASGHPKKRMSFRGWFCFQSKN